MVITNDKQKIWKSGNSFVITVPDYLFKAGLLNQKKKYYISITEKKEVEKNEDKYRSNNV